MTTPTSTSSLGARLREARNAKGLTQEKLAELVGTSRYHVIRWEKDIHTPKGAYAQRLADVLGVNGEAAA